MSDDTEQASIDRALADRTERRRRELGYDTKPVAAAGADLAVEEQEAQCACGETYRASILRQGDREPMRTPSACAKCRGRDAAAAEERTAAEKLEKQARSLDRRLRKLDPPPLYMGVTLDGFQHHGSPEDQRLQMRALSWARRYLAQFPDVVGCFHVLRGAFGSGKGHVAWSMARVIVEQHESSARVVKVPKLVRELRDTWRKDSGATYDQVLAEYLAPDFLVLDEASRHAFYGQGIHQHLYDVIDTRIERRQATILTTNEDDEGLVEILRPALVNRLEGEGGIVEFGLASWRSREEPTT